MHAAGLLRYCCIRSNETLMPLTERTFASPVPQAHRWISGRHFPADKPLINVSQAAPTAPPPEGMRTAMAQALMDPATHLYSADLGLESLREALADHWAKCYAGTVTADEVAITSGCNQAFAATMSALCDSGDEVLIPTPWYFNHKMWLDMSGVTAVALPTGADLIPDAEAARALITPRTCAISLVTPNNPGGVEYPAETLSAFFALARETGIRLIVDETYRDFDSRPNPPHSLLSDPNWDDTLIQLYSFSKAYRLTGHRVGAVIAEPKLLAEVEKFLDTVAICPSQLGQRAALWGLQNLRDWLAGERDEILDRRAAIHDHMPLIEAKGWRLMGCGAYFAYLEHPFAESSATLAPKLVQEIGVLALPGTMFTPDTDPSGARQFRVAFANVDRAGIEVLFTRLASLDWPLATPVPAA